MSGSAPDPVTALALAVTVAAFFGSPSGAGRVRGALIGAAAAAAVAGALLGASPAVALAAALGGATAYCAPAQGPRPREAWDAGGEGSAVARF
jgi:hypothetical protein